MFLYNLTIKNILVSNCSDPDYVQKLAKNICTSVQICALGAYAYSHSLNIHVQLSSGFRYIHFIGYATFVYPIQALVDDLNIMLINAKMPTIVGILTFISTINFVLS